jgi:hypothetical protein
MKRIAILLIVAFSVLSMAVVAWPGDAQATVSYTDPSCSLSATLGVNLDSKWDPYGVWSYAPTSWTWKVTRLDSQVAVHRVDFVCGGMGTTYGGGSFFSNSTTFTRYSPKLGTTYYQYAFSTVYLRLPYVENFWRCYAKVYYTRGTGSYTWTTPVYKISMGLPSG